MKSMTGFGRASLESNGKNYIIEIKTVNNKYSDITVKSPKRLSFMEDKIRKQIANRITRGKVEVSVSFFDFSNKSKNVVLNKEIAKEYIKQLREIADENNLSENISVVEIAKLPDILNSIDSDNDEEIAGEALKCLNMALDSLIEMRKAEGENIKQDLLVRIERVQNLVDKIAENSKGIVEEYVSKLEKRVKEILKTDVVDENRIAQEAVIYADKTSIEEELTRLNSHIVQFKELVNSDGPVGKKLDFMIQEMNRETNTIGSKAGSGEITKAVIDLKVELEDIREQIQNIE
ncbi:yicC domain protein [Clostridium sp. CAG:245]|mgnify:FL=1|jgi:TIGR00255 family protein|nr:yicC domain protein [Clostridium sp. CAG:245]